jgi:6,7-dimethyl-8-ribityllumazine synthase
MSPAPHILIVEGRYYSHISDELLRGAKAALRGKGATFDVVTVPGALEIPQVLSAAIDAGLFEDAGAGSYQGCVALGCVIRGETSHYDIVANESARQLLALATRFVVPLGNGILTVENGAQALARAAVDGKNKGGGAAEACLETIGVKRDFAARRRRAAPTPPQS